MADVKISGLPAASQANATDQLEANQSGTSRRVTLAQVLSYIAGALNLPWGQITGTPTTLSGYGITDGASDGELSAEATTRANADTALSDAIINEATTRASADTALIGALTTHVNGTTNVHGIADTLTLVNTATTRSANTFLGGPTSGGAASPTFRSLERADVPFAVPQPSDHGLLGWTLDPAGVNNTFAPTAGVIYIHRVIAAASGTVNNILTDLQAGGTTLTSSQCFAGLYDASGNRLGVTADTSGSWNTSGTKTNALTAGVAVTKGTAYYIAFVVNGSGLPSFRRSTTSDRMANFNLATSVSRFAGSTTTNNTSLPSSITISSFSQNPQTVINSCFWAMSA